MHFEHLSVCVCVCVRTLFLRQQNPATGYSEHDIRSFVFYEIYTNSWVAERILVYKNNEYIRRTQRIFLLRDQLLRVSAF